MSCLGRLFLLQHEAVFQAQRKVELSDATLYFALEKENWDTVRLIPLTCLESTGDLTEPFPGQQRDWKEPGSHIHADKATGTLLAGKKLIKNSIYLPILDTRSKT